MGVNYFSAIKRARFQNGREGELIRVHPLNQHSHVKEKSLIMETVKSVGVDNGSKEEDVRVGGLVKKVDRVAKATE